MSRMLETSFQTTPDTHAAANGHWDRAIISLEPGSGEIGPFDPFAPLSIRFQNGPVKDYGINGVQLPQVLRICLARYRMLNKSFPCRENSIVITKLQEALMWDDERTAKRTRQGVEGFDKPHRDEETA